MTGILNPPLVRPADNLLDDQRQRAAALLVVQQVLPVETLVGDMVAMAEYIVNGGGGYITISSSIADMDRDTEDLAGPGVLTIPQAQPTLAWSMYRPGQSVPTLSTPFTYRTENEVDRPQTSTPTQVNPLQPVDDSIYAQPDT